MAKKRIYKTPKISTKKIKVSLFYSFYPQVGINEMFMGTPVAYGS